MMPQTKAEITDLATNFANDFFPKYLYIIENKYDYNYQTKVSLMDIDIDIIFVKSIKLIEFENYSDSQINLFFEILDRHFDVFVKRNWTTFNYLTNLYHGNDTIVVPDEISFIKEEAFLKLVQDKIEEKRNQISLIYDDLKYHFLFNNLEQVKKIKKKKKKKENKEVFDLLDDIRENNYSKLDLRKILKKETDFDFDNLKYLYDDVELYINIESDEFQSNFSKEDIEEKIKTYNEKGLSIPYHKRITVENLTEKQIENRKKINFSLEPSVNIEALMFPFEFYSIYEFQRMIIAEISKHKKVAESKNETQETNINTKLKTNLSVPELALLFKLINDLKPNIFVLKSEAELLRFISSNFETKKTGENDISTQKLRILFNQPESKAAEFWETNLRLLLADVKKIK